MRLSEKTLLARIFSASLGAQHPALASEDSERLSNLDSKEWYKCTDLGLLLRIRVACSNWMRILMVIHPGIHLELHCDLYHR